jgi:hypothetical protein
MSNSRHKEEVGWLWWRSVEECGGAWRSMEERGVTMCRWNVLLSNEGQKANDASIYDLSGRRVADATKGTSGLAKGIYIMNGKKIAVQ